MRVWDLNPSLYGLRSVIYAKPSGTRCAEVGGKVEKDASREMMVNN